MNMGDDRPVTLRIKGHTFQAAPTVIREREAVLETVAELFKRRGPKKASLLPLGLPKDRQPTEAELQGIPIGGTFVRFKMNRQNQE